MMNKKLNESTHAVCYAVNIVTMCLIVIPFADINVCQSVVRQTQGDGDPYQLGEWKCVTPSEANDFIEKALNDETSKLHDTFRELHQLEPVTAEDVKEYGIRFENDCYDMERSFEGSMLHIDLYRKRKNNDLDESKMNSKIYSHDGDLDEEETDESYVSGDGGYGGDASDVIESPEYEEDMQSWLENGNPVKFKAGTGYETPGVWHPSQVDFERGRCWVGDEDDRGWYVSINHLEPYHGEEHEGDEELEEALELTAEDFIIPRNMSKSLAREVEPHPEGDEKDDDGVDDHDHESQAYIDRLRTLAGMNKV
jgi:hypothetical protein